MMTIHGAKGLEFHYVFIAGLGKFIDQLHWWIQFRNRKL